MSLKIKAFLIRIGIFFGLLLWMTDCKNLGNRTVLESRNIQWENCYYQDGTGYLSVKSCDRTKTIKFYTYKKPVYIGDMMIGNENELLISSGYSVESFIFLKNEGIKHSILYKFPKGWFIDNLIGRVGQIVWVVASYYSENQKESDMARREDYLVSIEKDKIKNLISLADLVNESSSRPRFTSWISDVCDNVPYFIVSDVVACREPSSKFYLCYYLPCGNSWFSKELPPSIFWGQRPFLKIGNKLISLGDKDIIVDLGCEKSITHPVYSKRNYYWPISKDKYVYLFVTQEENGNNKKMQTDLMCYDAKKDERNFLADIPNGYRYVVKKGKNSLVIRATGLSHMRHLEYNLLTKKLSS